MNKVNYYKNKIKNIKKQKIYIFVALHLLIMSLFAIHTFNIFYSFISLESSRNIFLIGQVLFIITFLNMNFLKGIFFERLFFSKTENIDKKSITFFRRCYKQKIISKHLFDFLKQKEKL